MMTHDPFQNYQTQNYQTPGAYPGAVTPFGLPYTAFQSPFNPAFNPMAQAGQPLTPPGIGGYGYYPQQPQGQGMIGGQHGPLQQLLALNQLAALQNPLFQQNPYFQQNPFSQQPLAQNPWQNPMLAHQGWPQQQQQPFAYPLAPQTLIGSGGIGQPFGQAYGQGFGQGFGQINPLAQLALRQAAGYGISPLAGSF